MMDLLDLKCPYLGLQPYTEEDQTYFFGRERDRRIIISNLYSTPLTILYGASGVGKSSVLLAGILPDLRSEQGVVVITFREWHDSSFLIKLKNECVREAEKTLNKQIDVDIDLHFDELLSTLSKIINGPTFVLFDQFEEYFSYHPDGRLASDFDIEFSRAINRQDINVSFLIVLREDGLYRMDKFKIRIPNLFENTLCLKHLDISAAEDAIRKPLVKYNEDLSSSKVLFKIEDKLVNEILKQVRIGKVNIGKGLSTKRSDEINFIEEKDVRIETAFLQLVMTRLWNEETSKRSYVLRLSTLEDLGGAEQIIRTHLDRVLNEFNYNEKELCLILFDRLVTPSGTKIALPEKDLADYAGVLAQNLPNILETLTKKRILRCIPASVDGSQSSLYEIFHDLLALAILDWQTRYKKAQMDTEVKQVRKDAFVANKNYNNLRAAIGFLIFLFPLLLVVGSFIFGESKLQNSLSAYYYTKMRDVYVGILVATAVLFQSYSGYNIIDRIISNLACLLLIGLAFFPGSTQSEPTLNRFIATLIHNICFPLFILTQSFFILFSFTKGTISPTRMKLKRNKVYRICGFLVIGSLFLMIFKDILNMNSENSIIFWLEWISFASIGISWITKGKVIFKETDGF